MIATEWCVCYAPCGLDAAAEVPAVRWPYERLACRAEGPHAHLCNRADGHTGRHAEFIDECLVSAVWP